MDVSDAQPFKVITLRLDEFDDFVKKSGEENARKAAEAQAAAPEPAPAVDAVSDPAKATSSLAVAAQTTPRPESTKITDTYARGSTEEENVGAAVGAVRLARSSIETTNLGASVYNNAKLALEDKNIQNQVLKAHGEAGLQLFLEGSRNLLADGLEMMQHGQAMMKANFQVSGDMLNETETGRFQPAKYSATAQGGGWSVEVKSTGEARALANGVDVSDQISDASSTGFRWSEQIAKSKAAEAGKLSGANATLDTLPPKSTKITDTYAKGSTAEENVGAAIGAVRFARASIETTNFGASVYNAAKLALEDETIHDKVRGAHGEEGLQAYLKAVQARLADGLQMMQIGQAQLKQNFRVSGEMLNETETGRFLPAKYLATAQGRGWSVEIKSTGEARASANGVDVSDQISDSSSIGFKWSEQIARSKAAEAGKLAGASTALDTLKKVSESYKQVPPDEVRRTAFPAVKNDAEDKLDWVV